MSNLTFSWLYLVQSGGITLVILTVCALVSWIIIVERYFYFYSKAKKPLAALKTLEDRYNDESKLSATQLFTSHAEPHVSNSNLIPIEYVLQQCLAAYTSTKDWQYLFEETKNRAIAEKLAEMGRYLGVQATIATVSPYIGLLGTVFGIIHAFSALGGQGTGTDVGRLNAGIAEALVATASGLFVAIPATAAYNYFRRSMQSMLRDIEIAAAYLKSRLLSGKKAGSS